MINQTASVGYGPLIVLIVVIVLIISFVLMYRYLISKKRQLRKIEKEQQKKQIKEVKRKLAKLDLKGKYGLIVFISYAFKDSKKFRIQELAESLISFTEIEEVVHCEEDALENFIRYMNIYIGKCDVLLLFCSKNTLNSDFVEMEWMAARAMKKPIIPVFMNSDHIPPLLRAEIGYELDFNNIQKNIEDLYKLILKKSK